MRSRPGLPSRATSACGAALLLIAPAVAIGAPFPAAQHAGGALQDEGEPQQGPEPCAEVGGAGRAMTLRAVTPARQRQLERSEPCFDARRWRERLTDPDIARRERAFDELVQELPRCGEGVKVLETWAASIREPELCWTARLALRELRRRSVALVLTTPHSTLPGLSGLRTIELADPLAAEVRLRSLDRVLEGVLESRSGFSLYAPRRVAFQGPPAASAARRHFELTVGPAGVMLEIAEREGAAEERRVLQAESLEALLERHPALADEVPGLADMALAPLGRTVARQSWGTGPLQLRFDPHGWRMTPRTVRVHGVELGGTHPPTRLLGVECVPAGPEDRARCELEPGLGLRVERTLAGTVAYAIELQRGDVLLALDGRPLRKADDIEAALSQRTECAPLIVELCDTSGQRRTITWRVEAGAGSRE